MADKLRKFRKDSYVDKKFGKDINISTMDEPSLRKPMSATETKSVTKAQPKSGASPLSFSAAFAAARKDGDKTFTWKGKSYTTQLASEKKAPAAPTRRAPAPAAKAPASNAKAPASNAKAPAANAKAPAATPEAPSMAAAFARAPGKPAAAAAKSERTEAQKRGDYATRLTQSAAEKRKLESAPTSTPGASWARLKNAVGFGSSADERLAATMRRSAANQAQNEARRRNAEAEDRAIAAKRIAEGKAKAKAGNPFYQSYLDKAKGGSVKGYAKGGKIDGCAVRGKTKAGRK